jgi:hypothetical protein
MSSKQHFLRTLLILKSPFPPVTQQFDLQADCLFEAMVPACCDMLDEASAPIPCQPINWEAGLSEVVAH